MNIKTFFFLFFVFSSKIIFCQDVNSSRFLRNFGLNASIIKGLDVSARDRNAPDRNFDALGYEVDLVYRTDGMKDWQKLYNNPRMGLALMYIIMPTDWLYGRIHAALPYMDFTLINRPTTMGYFRFGIGASYIDKQYDINLKDFQNNLIGHPYNLGIQFGLGFHQKVFSNTELSLEAGALNFSNGSLNAPNNGINLLYGKAGLNFFIYDRINHRV